MAEQEIHLTRTGRIDFFSYFNNFSTNKWRDINPSIQPTLRIGGLGEVVVRCWLHQHEKEPSLLCEQRLNLGEGIEGNISLPSVAQIDDGLIAPEIIALSEYVRLQSVQIVSDTPPLHKVKMGIVITHFNRQNQVLNACHRLTPLLREEGLAGQLAIVIIDNSQNLPETLSQQGVELIKNRNLGGSGGFARGLLHFDEEGTFTHCLFMDDDASCAKESIKRTIAALSYAVDESTAVAGAMLYEDAPYLMHENGARFDGMCKSLDHGKNLRRRSDVLACNQSKKIDYGAWWYYSFPIKNTKNYPFPFFVRGDDIAFGLNNDFKIITLNGICSWQERFEEKASPTTNYLDTRNHVTHIFRGNIKEPIKALKFIFKTFIYLRRDSYLYESAESALLAIEDTLAGPEFWVKNIDMSERRKLMSEKTIIEKAKPISDDLPQHSKPRKNPTRRSNKIARTLTANGILLPQWALRRRPLLMPRSFSADPLATFRHRQIVYLSKLTGNGFIATHDAARAIRITIKSWILYLNITKALPDIMRSYEKTNQTISSKEFWKQIYRCDS